MPRLRQVLRSVKIERGKAGKVPRTRLPITPLILKKMRPIWIGQHQSHNSVMLWAASLTTFFSFCRSGEITIENEKEYDPQLHLSFSNITVDNAESPKVISLNIKHSKTDQGAAGVRLILGKTDDDLCPVSALMEYLSRRGDSPGALFQWDNRVSLSKTKFVEAVRQALTAAGLPAKDYSGLGLSLRILLFFHLFFFPAIPLFLTYFAQYFAHYLAIFQLIKVFFWSISSFWACMTDVLE